MRKLTPVILLLVFALSIQNTCPFGTAGKSSVTASCERCPLMHGFVMPSNGQNTVMSDASSVHFPHYIFAVSKTISSVRITPIASKGPILANDYQDALPDELLQPPRG